MIEKIYGKYVLACDDCGIECEEEFDTFDDAVRYARSKDWKITRLPNEWLNICPDCQDS